MRTKRSFNEVSLLGVRRKKLGLTLPRFSGRLLHR